MGPVASPIRVRRSCIIWAPARSLTTRVLPEIALAKVRPDAPFRQDLLHRLRRHHGPIGAVMFTAKVEPLSRAIVFGLGGIGLNVIQGLKMVGARRSLAWISMKAKSPLATQFGMTDFVTRRSMTATVNHLVDMTEGGADYTFECIGNVKSCGQRLNPAIRVGAKASSLAWHLRALRFRPAPSSW